MKGDKRMKLYAWMGSLSLVCLFIGLFLGIMILAMKATEVFEGIPPSPAKFYWSAGLSVTFIVLSIALMTFVIRGVRGIREN